jgi:hypothetical protein
MILATNSTTSLTPSNSMNEVVLCFDYCDRREWYREPTTSHCCSHPQNLIYEGIIATTIFQLECELAIIIPEYLCKQ